VAISACASALGAAAAGLRLEHVVAICPVLDPEHTLHRLERGWALYRRYFIWKWRRSLRKKQAAWPQVYDLRNALELEDTHGDDRAPRVHLRRLPLADRVPARLCDRGRGARRSLASPTRIIAAADDPIIPAVDLARLARPAGLEITCTALGGHCGYFEGGHCSTWLEREVLATLERGDRG